MLVQQIADGTVEWSQLPVYLIAEFAAGVAAGFAYLVISRTPGDAGDAGPSVQVAEAPIPVEVGETYDSRTAESRSFADRPTERRSSS